MRALGRRSEEASAMGSLLMATVGVGESGALDNFLHRQVVPRAG